MTQPDKKRLIEDFLPIAEISYHAAREKSIRDGHISTLHLWWARRPLAAARAAVAGTLLPAPANQEQRERLKVTLAEACAWAGSETSIAELRRMILANNGGVPPKVLDMFAGGGAIPLEAARLGCESYAVDLNPVAHIIELCTLVYPQTYGPSLATDVRKWARWVLDHAYQEASDIYPFPVDPGPKVGSSVVTKTKSKTGKNGFAINQQLQLDGLAGNYQRTLGELGAEVEAETADEEAESEESQPYGTVPSGHLMPVAYLWTRTVTCPNTMCRATVPLARQLWLAKTNSRKVALRPQPNPDTKKVDFVIEEAFSGQTLSFDPDNYSKRGNTSCPFCGTAVDDTEVKRQGFATGLGSQLTAVICTNPGNSGKIYLDSKMAGTAGVLPPNLGHRLNKLMTEIEVEPLTEELQRGDSRNFNTTNYGMTTWGHHFTTRQTYILFAFLKWSKLAYSQMLNEGIEQNRAKAITSYLALLIDRLADRNSMVCRIDNTRETIANTYARQSVSMVWDFAELNPFGGASGSYNGAIEWVTAVINHEAQIGPKPVKVQRGSATELIGFEDNSMDAVITDPPYYDNVSYAALSDFFYAWLKRSLGDLYPEHFSYAETPKKQEAIAEPARQNKSKEAARRFYEDLMGQAFAQAYRVLKSEGRIVVVYAHKTTYGWSTLVDALRRARFVVTEAWPIDTEMGARLLGQGSAALASSIFIVAKKRQGQEIANFRRDVKPELDRIIAERIQTLMENKVSGADLVIATVGAALSAFTRWQRVELDNGEELDSVRFLEMVQGAVVDVLMRQALATEEGSVSVLDKVSQFYVLARFQYDYQRQPTILPKSANGKKPPVKKPEKTRSGTMGNWVDFDEMNVLARGVGVELNTLMSGPTPLVKKEKDKVALLGYGERGGLDGTDDPRFSEGRTAIDVLHQLLWLLNNPGAGVSLPAYFDLTGMDISKVSLLAHTLAGKALSGGATEAADGTTGMSFTQTRTPEQKMIDNLLVNFEGRLGRKGFI
jgi:putative DNA methylase